MMALGAALQRWGIPAHRLETRMSEVATALGVQAQFFSTPTSLTGGFGPMSDQAVRLARVDPGAVDLSKLIDLDEITETVAQGQLQPIDGLDKVREIDGRPSMYGAPLVIFAFALVAAGVARLFSGGLTEIWTSATAGLLSGALAVYMPRAPRLERLYELAAAVCVTVWVAGLQWMGVAMAPFVVILSGLIVLVPGLTLTVAVSELATKNLVSGSARLIYAGMSLLQLGFGVALGQAIVQHGFGPLAPHTPVLLEPWTLAVALVITAAALTVLFQAPVSLMPAVILVTAFAVFGARLGTVALTPQLGASVGALFVALIGNFYARWRRRPAVALIVPGMLVLVPGSLGFKSVNSLISRDLNLGIETAFNMGLVAVAIVAGLLVANVLLPPARGSADASSL